MKLLLINGLSTYLSFDRIELLSEFDILSTPSLLSHHGIIFLNLSEHCLRLFLQLDEFGQIPLKHLLIKIVFIVLRVPTTSFNLKFGLLLNELVNEGSCEALV